MRALPPDTGLLHAAELQTLAEPEDPADVARVEVRRQARLGRVGQCEGFLLSLEAEERCHRPEGLGAGYLHLRGRPGQHRRAEERAAKRVAAAAMTQLR